MDKQLAWRRFTQQNVSYGQPVPSAKTPSKDDKSKDELGWLTGRLKKLTLFKRLDEKTFCDVVDAIRKATVKRGDYLYKEDVPPERFYVIQSGTFGVFENRRGRNEFVANLTAGDCINESVLLHLPTKPSMAYARTDGIAWYVDRDTFSRLTIRKTYWDRFFKTKLIGNIPVLKYLQDDRKLLLAEAMEAKSFSDSQPIMTIGSIVEGLYFIVGGNVGVFNQTPRGTIHPQPTILHKGDYFGATSIDGRTEYARSAAYAIGQCNLMLLKSSSIYRIAGKD